MSNKIQMKVIVMKNKYRCQQIYHPEEQGWKIKERVLLDLMYLLKVINTGIC